MELLPTSLSFYLAIIASFLGVFLYHYINSTYGYWKDRNVPYIKPIFGNIKDLMFRRKSVILIHQEMYDQLRSHKYGGFFQLKTPTLLIRDPEIVERVLVKDFKHFHDRGFIVKEDDIRMANLFTLGGEPWRNLRYKLTPTFTTGKLKGMFDQINTCGEALVSYVEQELNFGKPIQTNTIFSGFSLDVIASCAFGLQMDKDDKMNIKMREMFNDVLNPSRGKIFIRTLLASWPGLNRILNINAGSKEMTKLIMSIVKDTAEYREKNNVIRNDFLQLMLNIRKQEQIGKLNSTHEDFQQEDEVIDQMKYASVGDEKVIQENKKVCMTDAVIAAQAFVFLIAGSETVASTISFTLLCLSQYSDIQQKAQKEIDAVLDKYKKQWSYEVVKEMEYLDQIIQVCMKDAVIAAQAFVFLIAGSETVASTISFTLLCLSQNPDIQRKAQKEIYAVLNKYKKQWSYEVVKEMDYLVQIIKETLRMYPITPVLIRSCTEPYKLPGSEAVIDVGTKLVIPIYSIHNDPQNYENPQVFDPDRFMDNNFKPNGSYLPFGNGPRICIGMRFAILEVKLVLARLLSQFTVKLNEKTRIPLEFTKTSTTIQIEGGHWFDFIKRA